MSTPPGSRLVPADIGDALRAAVQLAARAPSLHNSQPWCWRLGVDAVRLHLDPARRLPATDSAGRELVISCGAALHHLLVALAAQGWESRVHRLPDPADPTLLAEVRPVARAAGGPQAADVALADAIIRRRTDRRRFGSWPIPGELLGEMVELAD